MSSPTAAGVRASKVSSRLTTISKEMSYRLRHKPPAGMDASGWVAVPELIASLRCKPTEAEVRCVVETNNKKRFVLVEALESLGGQPAVRAAQGHSVQLESPILEPVTSAAQAPLALHVTGDDAWAAIQQDCCLRRMARSHIHFATAAHHVRRNAWVTVWLQLDLKAALLAGHTFYKAANGVLLTEGPLPLAFVTRIDDPGAVDWGGGAAATNR